MVYRNADRSEIQGMGEQLNQVPGPCITLTDVNLRVLITLEGKKPQREMTIRCFNHTEGRSHPILRDHCTLLGSPWNSWWESEQTAMAVHQEGGVGKLEHNFEGAPPQRESISL